MPLNENDRRWLAAHPEFEKRESMRRRHDDHDYYGRCVYLLTFCAARRRSIFGTLHAEDDRHGRPWIELSAVGEVVKRHCLNIPSHRQEISVLECEVMPDHVHLIVFVIRKMPCHLGIVVSGLKAGIRKELSEKGTSVQWEAGYNDTILRHKDQLENMRNYVRDNPRRLWVKLNNPNFFTQHKGVTIGNTSVTAIGNFFLLNHPIKVFVQCSRRMTEEQIDNECKRILSMAAKGAILVSACISQGEKTIMKRAFAAGMSQIIILENGFTPRQKPSGQSFDACAAGRLLLIAPWEHHYEKRAITREQCLALNRLAFSICGTNQEK